MVEVERVRHASLDGGHIQRAPKSHHEEERQKLGRLLEHLYLVDGAERPVLDIVQSIQAPEIHTFLQHSWEVKSTIRREGRLNSLNAGLSEPFVNMHVEKPVAGCSDGTLEARATLC